MAELVDAPDLGSGILGCEGSSPFTRTTLLRVQAAQLWNLVGSFLTPLCSSILVFSPLSACRSLGLTSLHHYERCMRAGLTDLRGEGTQSGPIL